MSFDRRVCIRRLVAGFLAVQSASTIAATAVDAVAEHPLQRVLEGLAVFAGAEADATVSVTTLEAGGLRLDALEVPLQARAGVVSVGDGRARIGTGSLRFSAKLHQAGPEPTWTLSLAGDDVAVEEIPALAVLVAGARVDMRADLTGSGTDRISLKRTVKGRILVTMGAGHLVKRGADRAYADLLVSLYQALNPFSRPDRAARLQCAVALLTVEGTQARARRSLALQTRRVAMLGGGRLDLETGTVRWTFRSRPKEGLHLAAGALVRKVRVRGTLSAPEFTTEGADWVTGGLQLPATLAGAGLERLTGLGELAPDVASCRTALGTAPASWQTTPNAP